jgi:hypothetical protein
MESAAVFGAIDNPWQYAILVRWHSDFMSASHTYVTDRPVLRHLIAVSADAAARIGEGLIPIAATGWRQL